MQLKVEADSIWLIPETDEEKKLFEKWCSMKPVIQYASSILREGQIWKDWMHIRFFDKTFNLSVDNM